MQLFFKSLPAELTHTCHDPETRKRWRFAEATNPHDVPDSLGEFLLKTSPNVFGRSISDIMAVRGVVVKKAVASKTAGVQRKQTTSK